MHPCSFSLLALTSSTLPNEASLRSNLQTAPGRNDAEKTRQVLRRLARRRRSPQTKILHHRGRRFAPSGKNGQGIQIKKIADAGSLGQLARVYSQGRRPEDIDYRAALHIIDSWSHTPPHALTAAQVLSLVLEWDDNYAHSTAHGYTKALKRFLRTVDETHSTRLARFVPRRMAPQPRRLTVTDDDFAAICAASPLWLKVFLAFCRTLGLRHSESRELTPDALNEDTATLIFSRKDQGTSHIPLTPDLLATIRLCKIQAPHEPIIRTLGAPASPKSIQEAFDRAKKRAGVRSDLIIHDLRRTGITRIYDDTHDIRLCQQFAGHRNINSTLPYIAHTDKQDQLAEAIRRNAPRDLHALKPATEVKQ